ncbi:hypothetical protein G6F24_018792 [Rhizopus arrhizus]|nr:hypothetical protein G6F24_018792 [Rhizopus arrhizus]
MRRSRSMDAPNGPTQCDSTSVSLDRPSRLFSVSAVTRKARSPSEMPWSELRRTIVCDDGADAATGAAAGAAKGGSYPR